MGFWWLLSLEMIKRRYSVIQRDGPPSAYAEMQRRKYPASGYVVIVGKYFSYINSEDPKGEIVPVREIFVHPYYFGKDTNWAFNIALVVLGTSVSSMPACVDWDREFLITPGETVTMAALTKHDEKLEYVDYVSCVFKLKPEDRHRATHDKFCSMKINDNFPVPDFGLGVMVEKNGVHYIKGVMDFLLVAGRGNPIYLATNLSDMTILQWLHETKLTIDAAYNDT